MNNSVLIDAYSRKQAIEDGVLVDISKLSKEKGFKCNVCVTVAVWNYISTILELFKCQDVTGRTWDMLNILFYRAKGCNSSIVEFKVHMPHEITVVKEGNPDSMEIREKITFISEIGPGDIGEMVITIRLPNKD